MKERSPDAHIADKIELCQIKGIYKCQETKQQDNIRPDSKAHNDKMLSGPEIRGCRSRLHPADVPRLMVYYLPAPF